MKGLGLFEPERPTGLFIQVIDRMLVTLAVVWPAIILVTYLNAIAIAAAPYDRELSELVRAVVGEVRKSRTAGSTQLAIPALEVFRFDPIDRVYIQVARTDGKVVAGDFELSPPDRGEPVNAGVIHFRDAMLDGVPLRIAYEILPEEAGDQALVVQVGRPRNRREVLAGEVVATVMGVVMFLVPVTVGLVWLGLYRGLAPVRRLRDRVAARGPGDASPIPPGDAPEELMPLIDTLNHQLERVRRNFDTQRRFVADAAHQMRTPLAGLKTQAQAAIRSESLDDARERLARIEESAGRLSRLVTQLLVLARADDADALPPGERVEMNALLRAVCADHANAALAKGVALAFDAASADVEVAGNAVLLRELFANLVDNAIRYTPAGGEVTVSVKREPHGEVLVDDSGVGIPEGERALVFERFYRVLGSAESGSGLGLPIVSAIARAHRGTVAIEDGPSGRGARFRVTFAS